MNLFYVYILQSISHPEHFYTGYTQNLEQRLNEHNQGKCSHTSKHLLWKLETAVSFTDKEKALSFEKYLKSASGRAFAKKRLWQIITITVISQVSFYLILHTLRLEICKYKYREVQIIGSESHVNAKSFFLKMIFRKTEPGIRLKKGLSLHQQWYSL